jgi:hypothetical protein
MATQSRFISFEERRKRIEIVLRRREWSWYRLSQEMNMAQTTVQRLFKFKLPNGKEPDPQISMIRRLARATNTSMGFWLDRKETQ